MNDSEISAKEQDIQAYTDRQLPLEKIDALSLYLDYHPEDASRIEQYQLINKALKKQAEAISEEAEEPVIPKRRNHYQTIAIAASIVSLVAGGLLGWFIKPVDPLLLAKQAPLPVQARFAHMTYASEITHPVEVSADQQSHLVKWLSKRLDRDIEAPDLTNSGYSLVGGRLLPNNEIPAAQLMYENPAGKRLTLYIRVGATSNETVAFRFSQANKISTFYWVDGPLGYALSGQMEKDNLYKIAEQSYRQLY